MVIGVDAVDKNGVVIKSNIVDRGRRGMAGFWDFLSTAVDASAPLIQAGATSIMPAGTVVDASGTVIRQTPGYAVPYTQVGVSGSLSGAGSNTTGILIGVGVAVLVLVMMKGRR